MQGALKPEYQGYYGQLVLGADDLAAMGELKDVRRGAREAGRRLGGRRPLTSSAEGHSFSTSDANAVSGSWTSCSSATARPGQEPGRRTFRSDGLGDTVSGGRGACGFGSELAFNSSACAAVRLRSRAAVLRRVQGDGAAASVVSGAARIRWHLIAVDQWRAAVPGVVLGHEPPAEPARWCPAPTPPALGIRGAHLQRSHFPLRPTYG